jgi:hypothetical protein
MRLFRFPQFRFDKMSPIKICRILIFLHTKAFVGVTRISGEGTSGKSK